MGTSAYTETLELAGRIIMENGGETYRAEETIARMGKAFGLDHAECFAVPSGVFISYRLDGHSESAIVRVRRKGTNLERIDQVNQVSRSVESGDMDVEAALVQLRAIEHSPARLKPLYTVLLVGLSSGGFTFMFGGAWIDFFAAFVVASLVHALSMFFENRGLTGFMVTLIGGFFTALLPTAFCSMAGIESSAMIAGALMPLVPGVAMTNAIQDTLRGDLLSGVAHCVQAILTATLMAVGALIGVSLFQLLGGAA